MKKRNQNACYTDLDLLKRDTHTSFKNIFQFIFSKVLILFLVCPIQSRQLYK